MTTVFSYFGSIEKLSYIKDKFFEKKILLVTGKSSFEKCGARIMVKKLLNEKDLTFFSDFSVNPKIEDVFKGIELAKKANIEIILAIGGGSVIDMAKLIKAFINSPKTGLNTLFEERLLIDSRLPLIAIPTTAGSGSEATHFAVVYINEKKYSVASSFLLPNISILDGQLSQTSKPYNKTCHLLDALAQGIESYWAINANDESRNYALECIKLCIHIVKDDYQKNLDPSLAQKMITAANLSGKAINISKTTSAHAWSYGFTSFHNIPHGHAVWLTLPKIFEIHLKHTQKNNQLKLIMETLIEKLELFNLNNINKELKNLIRNLGVETSFDKLNISKRERLGLSSNINIERMRNNPVKFNNKEVNYIFEL